MTEALHEFPKAFAIWFKDLERWDCSFFRRAYLGWSKEFITPLNRVLHRKIRPVAKTNATSDLPIIEKITFGGVMSVTDIEERKAYKGRLFWAESGDLIYSKIRAKQGSLAIVPHEIGKIAVSAEYPVYAVDSGVIDSRYLELVLRSRYFLNLLEGLSHGGSTKTRIPPEQFERLEIPLPKLPVQQAIVDRWRKAQGEIKEASERIKNLEEHIGEGALYEIEIALARLKKRNKAFSIYWHEIEKWGVEFNRWIWDLSSLLLSQKYPMVTLSDEAFVNPSEDIMLNNDDAVSFVPMESVSDKLGAIVSPQIRKYSEVKNGYTRFKNDDVIWAKITPCMQNGKGAVATNLVNGIGFGSTEFHVIRSKDKNRLLPEYIWILLRLNHLRQAAQRYFIGSAGQQRVPADFLANLQIPLPPIDLQHYIAKRIKEGYLEIAREREAAEQKSREIKAEIEALILGTKRIDV